MWLWSGETTSFDFDARPPATLHDPVYALSTPLIGKLDPVTHEPDEGGVYVTSDVAKVAPAGSVVRTVTNGAGGWGDPFTREVDKVVEDVRDGYVTIAGAARDYGVVVLGDPESDPEGLVVDEQATEELRGVARAAT